MNKEAAYGFRAKTNDKLVIVTPVYNEEANIERYAQRVSALTESLPNVDAQVLLIDDGSRDGSWKKIQELVASSNRFSAIRLSRNYGSHLALAAGFDSISDDVDVVATLACDLQDPPETILSFVESWRGGANIVWGQRRTRADEGWKRKASQILESTLRRFAMPRYSKFTTGSFLLIDKKVLDCVREFREQSRVTFALVAWTGFDQTVVSYDRQPRIAGKSGWNFGGMINTAYDVLIGFSPLPAKIITAIGLGMCSLSTLTLMYLLITWAFSDVQPGWTGVMTTMTVCFGLLFMMVGIVAEYLHRIFIETKSRPLYFVSSRAGEQFADAEREHA